MGIDGIGRKGPLVPVPPVGRGAPAKVSPSRDPFELRPAAASTPPGSVDAAGLAPLDRLRAGTITPGEYVDLKVEQATSHLTMLSPAELESVRTALRDHMASDPSLSELVEQVRAATGAAPPAARDD